LGVGIQLSDPFCRLLGIDGYYSYGQICGGMDVSEMMRTKLLPLVEEFSKKKYERFEIRFGPEDTSDIPEGMEVSVVFTYTKSGVMDEPETIPSND